MSVSAAMLGLFALSQAVAGGRDALGWALAGLCFCLVSYVLLLFMRGFGYESRDLGRALGLTNRRFLRAGLHRRPHVVERALPHSDDDAGDTA